MPQILALIVVPVKGMASLASYHMELPGLPQIKEENKKGAS
jgi:hypothetical protein